MLDQDFKDTQRLRLYPDGTSVAEQLPGAEIELESRKSQAPSARRFLHVVSTE
jgi:hypothetical protein